MSREIKFRYWSDLDNQWFYKTIDQIANETWSAPVSMDWQQYTGLKDKNGVEIYEGDIVHIFQLDSTVQVKWFSDDEIVGFNLSTDFEYEVIGNIYENKELLK